MSKVEYHFPTLTINDDWLFYHVAEDRAQGYFYKINIDSGEKIKIPKEIHDSTNTFQIYGDWIYYTHEFSPGIHKVSTGGTQHVQLSDIDAGHFWIHDDWIFF